VTPAQAGARHYFHVHDHDDLDDDNDVLLTEDDAPEVAPDRVPDQVQLSTAAVHVGSATVHFLLTRLTLRRLGVALMSRYEVVAKDDVYRSPVWFTPYAAEGMVDAAELERLLATGFVESGLGAEDLDTGIVLASGTPAHRANADAIGELVGRRMSAFVFAVAGPHLEARVAATGSGATALSNDQGSSVLNLDVGGETTNLALVTDGRITATAALNVGGRLVIFDGDIVTAVSTPARSAARAAGIEVVPGRPLHEADRRRLAAALADAVVDVLTRAPAEYAPLTRELLLTDPPELASAVDAAVLLSGGVAEYVGVIAYPELLTTDLGPALAAELLAGLTAAGVPVRPAPERIRATVTGLSQFTTQLSGDTVFVSSEAATPQRNLSVVPVDLSAVGDDVSSDDVLQAVRSGLTRADRHGIAGPVALAVDWNGRPYFRTLTAIAQGVALAAERDLPGGAVVVTLTQDCARSLGRALREAVAAEREVVCIDGLQLSEHDFIDVGAPIEGGRVVPVVVKTLLFSPRDCKKDT
jgi:ethanolamine utilization protein EutA